MARIVTTSSNKSKNKKSPLLVTIIIVALGALLYFVIGSNKKETSKDVAPSVEPETISTNVPALPVKKPVAPPAPVKKEQAKAKEASTNKVAYVKKPGQMMLPSGKILTFKPPAPGSFRIIHSKGRQYKCDSEGNWEDITPQPIFDNYFEENLIGLSIDGGTFIPGMLMGYDDEVVMSMLKRPVQINEEDDETVIAKKEAVAEMKGIILDYIEQGGTFDEFVAEMRVYTVHERNIKGLALKRIASLYNQGKLEEAQAFLKTFDDILQQDGFSPLRLPPKMRAAFNVEQEPSTTK